MSFIDPFEEELRRRGVNPADAPALRIPKPEPVQPQDDFFDRINRQPFDPQGTGYDVASALRAGFSPDEKGHWPSRMPLTPKEAADLELPAGSGLMLKGLHHETWREATDREAALGYEVVEKHGRWFSVPLNIPPKPPLAGSGFQPMTAESLAQLPSTQPPDIVVMPMAGFNPQLPDRMFEPMRMRTLISAGLEPSATPENIDRDYAMLARYAALMPETRPLDVVMTNAGPLPRDGALAAFDQMREAARLGFRTGSVGLSIKAAYDYNTDHIPTQPGYSNFKDPQVGDDPIKQRITLFSGSPAESEVLLRQLQETDRLKAQAADSAEHSPISSMVGAIAGDYSSYALVGTPGRVGSAVFQGLLKMSFPTRPLWMTRMTHHAGAVVVSGMASATNATLSEMARQGLSFEYDTVSLMDAAQFPAAIGGLYGWLTRGSGIAGAPWKVPDTGNIWNDFFPRTPDTIPRPSSPLDDLLDERLRRQRAHPNIDDEIGTSPNVPGWSQPMVPPETPGSISAAQARILAHQLPHERPNIDELRYKPTGTRIEELPINAPNRIVMRAILEGPILMLQKMLDLRMYQNQNFDLTAVDTDTVQMRIRLFHTQSQNAAHNDHNNIFLEYRGKRVSGDPAGDNFRLLGTAVTDLVRRNGQLSMDEFARRVGDAVENGDADLITDAASPSVNAAAARWRKHIDFVTEEAVKVDYFRTNYRRQIQQEQDLIRHLIGDKKLEDLKEGTKELIQRAEARIALIQKDLDYANLNNGRPPKPKNAPGYLPTMPLRAKAKSELGEVLEAIRQALIRDRHMSPEEAKRIAPYIAEDMFGLHPRPKEDLVDPFIDSGFGRARTLDIDHKWLKPWRENNIVTIMQAWTRKVAPEVELARAFGDWELSGAFGKIGQEYDDQVAKVVAAGRPREQHIAMPANTIRVLRGEISALNIERRGVIDSYAEKLKELDLQAQADPRGNYTDQIKAIEAEGQAKVEVLQKRIDIFTERLKSPVALDEEGKPLTRQLPPYLTQEQVNEEVNALRKNQNEMVKDLTTLRDMLRGTYAAAPDPSALSPRIARQIKNVVNMTTLEGAAITNLADLGRMVLVNGLANTIGTVIMPLSDGTFKALRAATRRELQQANWAMELIQQSHALSSADAGDHVQNFTRFERGMNQARDFFFYANGMNYVTQLVEEVAGMVVMGRMNDLIIARARQLERMQMNPAEARLLTPERPKLSKLPKIPGIELKDDVYLAYLGIDDQAALAIAREIDNANPIRKQIADGNHIILPETGMWSDPELRFRYRAAIDRGINRIVITRKVGDAPDVFSTTWGSVLFMFKGYGMAAVQGGLLPGLQEGHRGFAVRAAALVGMGAMTGAVRDLLADRRPPTSVGDVVLGGIDRSGIFGWFMDLNNITERITNSGIGVRPLGYALGLTKGNYPTTFSGFAGAVGGPAAGQAAKLITVPVNPGALRSLVPFADAPGVPLAVAGAENVLTNNIFSRAMGFGGDK